MKLQSISLRLLGSLTALLGVMAMSSPALANFYYDSSVTRIFVKAGGDSTKRINLANGYPYATRTEIFADVDHYACFLSGMRGDFNGAGEGIRIVNDGGYWAIRAESGSGAGVEGAGSCIRVPDKSFYTSERTWTWYQSNPAPLLITPDEPLKSGYGWECFLTRIAGEFQGSGEDVKVYQSGRNWYVAGSSGKSGVRAEARCVQTSWANGTFQAEATSAAGQYGNFTRMIAAGGTNSAWTDSASPKNWPQSPNRCFFRRVTGKFNDVSDGLLIAVDGSAGTETANYWYLEAFSRETSRVLGSVSCL